MITKRISKKNKVGLVVALMIVLTVFGFCMGAANADYVMIREAEIKVTDAGRFKNHCDTIRLPESKAAIVAKGYKYIRISIRSIMREKNDGYQSVFIYTGAHEAAAFLYEFKFEHSPDQANVAPKTIVNIVSINISYFTGDEFVIRYGASGNGADTYYVRDVKVKFEYTNTQGNDYITIDGVTYVNKGAN